MKKGLKVFLTVVAGLSAGITAYQMIQKKKSDTISADDFEDDELNSGKHFDEDIFNVDNDLSTHRSYHTIPFRETEESSDLDFDHPEELSPESE